MLDALLARSTAVETCEPGSRHTEDQVAYSVPAFLECLSLLWGAMGWSLAGRRLTSALWLPRPLPRWEETSLEVVKLHGAVAVAGAVAGGAVAADVDVPVPRVQGTAW